MIEKYKNQKFLEQEEKNSFKYAVTGVVLMVLMIAVNL